VLNAAVVPARPSQPRITLNIALSFAVGTILGIAIVLLMEMSDRRVRSVGDLHLDVPLLAVLNTWRPTASRLLAAPHKPRALPALG